MVTHFGSFEWKSLPKGLNNAPSVFMRAMEYATQDLRDKNGKQFIADVPILSKNTLNVISTLLFTRLEEKKTSQR